MIPILVQGVAALGLCASLVLGSMGLGNVAQDAQVVQKKETVLYEDVGTVNGWPFVLEVKGDKTPQKINIEINKKGDNIKIIYDREGELSELDKKYVEQIIGTVISKESKKSPIPGPIKKFFRVILNSFKAANKQLKKSW